MGHFRAWTSSFRQWETTGGLSETKDSRMGLGKVIMVVA